MKILIQGWLRQEVDFGGHEFLQVADGSTEREQPLAERLEEVKNKAVTARYWVCEKKCTREEAQDYFLRNLMGLCDVTYAHRYSEYTGYLWTDEYLKVGGHDIIEELANYVGSYLILELDVHQTPVEPYVSGVLGAEHVAKELAALQYVRRAQRFPKWRRPVPSDANYVAPTLVEAVAAVVDDGRETVLQEMRDIGDRAPATRTMEALYEAGYRKVVPK